MPPQVPSPPQPPSSGQQDPLQRRHCRWRRQGKGPAKGTLPGHYLLQPSVHPDVSTSTCRLAMQAAKEA